MRRLFVALCFLALNPAGAQVALRVPAPDPPPSVASTPLPAGYRSPTELKKLPLEQLVDVEITSAARRPEPLSQAASAVDVITGEDIRRAGVTNLPDAFRLAPLFYNTFQGGRAGHMVVLGQTGSGKTYFLNVMTLRIAAALGWRVIWIDSNENGPRLERACKDGLRRHEVGLSSTLNLLDPVYGPTDGAHWRLSQAQYVTSALALLIGP